MLDARRNQSHHQGNAPGPYERDLERLISAKTQRS
jgi:hypothetical protein